MQQLLTESLLLALLGGAAGLLLASLGSRAALSAVPLEEITRHQIDLSPDGRVLLFTVGISLLTGIVFGLIPAWSALRFRLTPGLNAQGVADQNRSGRPGLQFALIAVQVAVCLALLVNAGLLLRGFRSALTGDAGQAMSNVLVASFDLRQQQYTAEQATRYITTLRENAAALAGVRSASTTFVEPLHDECGTAVSTVGQDGQKSADILVSCDEVGPDFFRTMRIPLLTGREFTVLDQKTDGAVAVIDEDLARMHFKGAHALGRYVRFGREGRPLEVVGVAAATKALNPGTNRSGKIYTPMQGLRNNEAKLVVSYEGSFQDVDKGLRKAAAGLDPNVTLRSRRVEESVRDALLPARLASAAAGALGAFALLLAGTGIYGVVAFAVTRRRKEMGIRVALGADRSQVMRLVIWQGMQPVLTGTVLGMALAAGAAQTIRSLLYGVSPLDPIAFTGMALVLAAAGLFASVIPARAALSVDPALTLRQE